MHVKFICFIVTCENIPELVRLNSRIFRVRDSIRNIITVQCTVILTIMKKVMTFLDHLQKAHDINEISPICNIYQTTVTRDMKEKTFGFDATIAYGGCYVSRVDSNSSAEQAGLGFGDRLLQIDGCATAGLTAKEIADLLRDDTLSHSLVLRATLAQETLTVLRDNTEQGRIGIGLEQSEPAVSMICEVDEDSSAMFNGVDVGLHALRFGGIKIGEYGLRAAIDDDPACWKDRRRMYTLTV